jgi:hypothetical protein
MYVGTNSAGDNPGAQDIVEIYAKTTLAQSEGDPANVGTRLFITPGSAGGFGFYVGNNKVWDPDSGTGISQCDVYFTSVGLHLKGDIWLTGAVHENSSQTITHKTNIINFKPEQIGCFCESTGEIADVYDEVRDDGSRADYVPTLDRATDAICKIKHTKSFSSRIVGIITDYDTFGSHGDVLCRVVNDSEYSIKYEVGQLLYPRETGLCRIATQEEALLAVISGVPLPKITWTQSDLEFVGCFIV